MKFRFSLGSLSTRFRQVLGGILVILGVPLYLLPLPLGLLVMAGGIMLISSASPGLLRRFRDRFPGLYRRLRPILERCKSCMPPS